MNMIRLLGNAYGDLRGYGRSRIREEVRRNVCRSVDEIAAMQSVLFQRRVRDAIARFPAYAEKVRSHCGTLPATADAVAPASLPIWTRQDQRELFANLNEPPIPGAFVHSTGGSTGEPTRFYVTRESYEWRTAVSDRGYSWAGAEEGRKSYYVWGTPIKPLSLSKKLRTEIQHAIQRRKYFDSFIFNDERKAACCREINRYRPPALVGYAGNLVALALFARANPGQLRWKDRTLVTGAEGLQPGQRELLQETLADEVFMSYGSREFMLIGMECSQHKGYHISADNLYVEVVDEQGRPAEPGQTGRILVTDLHNDANPFIRYEIGDMGAMAPEPCSCGLPFPLLARVEGRIQEYLLTADGSRLTALFIPHLMKEFVWVRGYQLVQKDRTCVCVNVVAEQDPSARMTEPMVQALKAKLGENVSVTIQRVGGLQKGASGKVSIVIQA
jgi:phenylacetate-CoA ligase